MKSMNEKQLRAWIGAHREQSNVFQESLKEVGIKPESFRMINGYSCALYDAFTALLEDPPRAINICNNGDSHA